MANVLVNDEYLSDIADSIRAKNGSSDTYTPAQMSTAITNLPSGISLNNNITKTDFTQIPIWFRLFDNLTSDYTITLSGSDAARFLFSGGYYNNSGTINSHLKIVLSSTVTSLQGAFNNSNYIRIPDFMTNILIGSGVVNLSQLFYGMSSGANTNASLSVWNIEAIKNWNTSNIKNFYYCFYGKNLYQNNYASSTSSDYRDITLNWDVTGCQNDTSSGSSKHLYGMFQTSTFTSISGLYTTSEISNLVMTSMFSQSSSYTILRKVLIPNLKAKPLNISNLFYNCKYLELVDIRGLVCSNITSSSYYSNALYNVPTTVKIVVKDSTEKTWWKGKFSSWSSCFYTVTEAINAGIITS